MFGKENKKSVWYIITHKQKMDRKEYLNLVHRVSIFVALGFIASFIVFFIIALIGGLGRVVNLVLSSNLYIYSLAFIAVFAGYILRFIKWNYYLKKLKVEVPLKKNFIVYMSMYSMNITPGKLGRILVAYTLNRITKKSIANLIPVVTLDIFTDFLGFAILALVTAIYFKTFIIYILIIDLALILPFLFILNDWLYKSLKKAFSKRSGLLKIFSMYGDEYFASQSKLNTKGVYIVSMLVTVPAAFLNSMALYFALYAIGIVPHIGSTVFAFSSAQLFGMVTGIPGNIGITDGALIALLHTSLSLSTGISSAITIMTRFATLWFGLILGGILLVYSFRYWKAHV